MTNITKIQPSEQIENSENDPILPTNEDYYQICTHREQFIVPVSKIKSTTLNSAQAVETLSQKLEQEYKILENLEEGEKINIDLNEDTSIVGLLNNFHNHYGVVLDGIYNRL